MFNNSAQLFGQETLKASNVRSTLRRFLAYFRPYWLILLMVLVFLVGSTYMTVLVPDLIGQSVDCYLTPFIAGEQAAEFMPFLADLPESVTSQITPDAGFESNCWYTTPDLGLSPSQALSAFGGLILIIVGLYVFSAIFTGLQFYLTSWAGYHVLRDLRAKVFVHVHRLSLGYFSKHEAGDVMSRFTNDMDTIQQVIGFGLVQVASGIMLLFWIIWTMMRLSVGYALLTLITLPFMFVVTVWLSSQARKAFRRARQEIGSVNADLQENIAAVREVQAFGREEENITQFREGNAANRDANIRAQAFSSALAPSLEALSYVSMAIVAVVGGLVLINGGSLLGTTVSLGLVITFIGYSQQFNRPVQQIAILWTNIQNAIAGAERIFNLLDATPDVTDSADAIPLPHVAGHIKLENVWAEYNPGEPVLRGIDIEAQPGETVAIVGPTGAGKTTIINLLPRFWDVSAGKVTFDGYDVRDVTRHSLRSQIGIVLQDTFLFSDTVANNIRYGKPDATDEEVIEAAKLARAHDFIQNLENGYETILGERGSGLSQGQRQLIAIARVAMTDPRILILDEATSSVDTRTEREIQAALNKLLAGRTSFVIAHRLSTIRNASQVLYVEAGEIVEKGTHTSLLEQKGKYYDLYMSQFRRTVTDESVDEELTFIAD